MRDAKAITTEAAQLRAQAKALHKAAQESAERNQAETGSRIDKLARDASAARGDAKQAAEQASQAHDEAKRLEEEAADTTDLSRAQVLRAAAEGQSERAQRAHEAAREATDRAIDLEREAETLQHTANSEDLIPRRAMEHAARQLDMKAEHLEEAAATYRRIDVEEQQDSHVIGEDLGTARRDQEVGKLLEQADAIKPDFTGVPTAVLRDAGVPPSQQPGSELIDPYEGAPAPAPAGVDVHGDDLIDPYSSSAVDATGDAGDVDGYANITEPAPEPSSVVADDYPDPVTQSVGQQDDLFPAEEPYVADYESSSGDSYEPGNGVDSYADVDSVGDFA